MDKLPFRQIHLDFHTSEAIPGVGKDWDKSHFQEMLHRGHVSSITVFAKCHHGWCYYPTKVPLSQRHPQLKPGLDLLGEMIEAANSIGVQTPVYISCGLDEKLVRSHSHWLRLPEDGHAGWPNWMKAGYNEFCMRSDYLDYLVAQTEEIVRGYDMPGLFMDIVGVRDCGCQSCVQEMLKRGWDPRSKEDRLKLGRETYINYCRRINEAVHGIKPHVRVFHNGGHITRGDRELAGLDDHFELESLPTGGWGYDHFPQSARYVQQLGKEFLGMTGKFHTTWGEFGGFKHPNALRYEAALAIANGAKVSVGDQLHPYAALDAATYALIGQAYSEVEAKEPWLHGVTSVADVGVISEQAVRKSNSWSEASDTGAIRVLQEGHILYDVLDADSDFSKYRIIILADVIPVDEPLRAKLQAYLDAGGKILATGDSALDSESGAFQLDFGVKQNGLTPYSPEYIVPLFPLRDWAPAAFVVYSQARDIEVTHAKALAERRDPFFNRDYLHFCSHQHAPDTHLAAGPAMVRTDNTVYIAFPAFALYADKGQNVLREIILHGLRELLPDPTLVTSLPSQGIQTVMRQEGRTVIHLLYASPVARGTGIQVIEDLLPVRDVTVTLRTPTSPNRVYLAPQDTDLPFKWAGGVVRTVVPEMVCHQMVVVE